MDKQKRQPGGSLQPAGSAPLGELLTLESRMRDIGVSARKLAEDIDRMATSLAVAGSTIAQNDQAQTPPI
jgi:hypothetical protein